MAEETQGRLSKRLGRILVLLPYAIQHPGVSVAELARKFDVTKKDLLDDLNLVFLCGLPGYGPGDLIDVELQEDRVYVRMADYFAAPLRLTPTEALALYAGATALAKSPALGEDTALQRAVVKLGRALGVERGEGEGSGIAVTLEPASEAYLGSLRGAITDRKQVAMEYFTASRGELARRTADPWGLIAARGHWYLIAGDHSSGEERMFRLDRIKSLEVLDADADVPDEFDPSPYKGAFRGDGGEERLRFEISPEAATWFQDYYPVEEATDLPDGWRRIELLASTTRWAAMLILQLGEQVRAVEPPVVAAEVKSLAATLTAAHS